MYVADNASKVISVLRNRGFKAYVVGGCVRDSLLGLTPSDWDICTSALPDEIIESFPDYKVITTGIKHGTVTVIIDKSPIEITTFRGDGSYSDSRHPDSVEFYPKVERDLARRDFTINAMAYSHEDGLIDLYNGENDLNDKIIRCVGEPKRRFDEDALRILRALRFAAVYNLKIEEKTAEAIHLSKDNLAHISGERIQNELFKFVSSPYCHQLIMEYRDVFSSALGVSCYGRSNASLSQLPHNIYIRLFGFIYILFNGSNQDLCSFCSEILKRLKVSRQISKNVLTFATLFNTPVPETLAETRRIAGETGLALYKDFLMLYEHFTKEDCSLSGRYIREIEENNLCCSLSQLDLKGRDILELNMAQDKDIGILLKKALDMVIDQNLPNEKNVILENLFV